MNGSIRTGFDDAADLLCTDWHGNLVVVELKKGQTPRDVTSQTLEYSSWVKDLDLDGEVTFVADSYPSGSGSLVIAIQEIFEADLPDQLNQGPRSLIVAESVDASDARIVRCLVEIGVQSNVSTARHLEYANDR